MMKKNIFFGFFFLLFGLSIYSQIPTFQVTKGVDDLHFHDLNIEPIQDGSLNYIVSGNLFDAGLNNYNPFLMRVDFIGNVVWLVNYFPPEIESARCFDIVVVNDIIAMTGSADLPGSHKVFVAEFNILNGAFINSSFYEILDPNFHGRGLHIIATEAPPVPGYVVGGFVSNNYPLSIGNLNFGFAIRIDPLLNPIWHSIVDTNTGGSVDFDMVNHVTETPSGFFLTGANTAINATGAVQQGVLAHKLDFLGAFLWDSSYTYLDMEAVSVDAYYDNPSQQLHMLCNYQNTKYFGNTAILDATGAIDYPKSWLAMDIDDPDKYGFTITESVNSPNHLSISGYDRNESWVDDDGISQTGQSNIFVYEFDMITTTPVGQPYQYLVPHLEPVWDEFNFWNSQMPLIYYPEISLIFHDASAPLPHFFHVGYRTRSTINFTEVELVQTSGNLVNECENLTFSPTIIPFEPYVADVFSFDEFSEAYPLMFIEEDLPHNLYTCASGAGVDENETPSFQLFPNPTMDYLNVEISQSIDEYSIVDSLGRMLLHSFFNNEKFIDVSNLDSGIYYIKLYNKDRMIASNKFIKK